MSTSAPTELEVQQAESNSKRTEQAARQASEAAARDLATVGAQQDELLRQMERLSFSCDESQLETALLQENKRLQGAQAAGKEQLNQAVVRQRRQKQLQSALIPQAEQREQTLLQTLTEAKEREAQLSYRCEQEQETLQQEFQRLLPTIKQCKDSLLVNTAEAAVADLSHHLAQAERAVSIQQARVDRKAALEQAIPPLEEEQKNAARELETLRVEIVTAQGECAHLKQTTEALRKGLPYPSRAAAETALLRLRKQKLNIEQGIAAAESQCAEQAAALNRAHGVVKSLQGQLAAAPQYDLPLLQTKERELLEQQTAQRQALLAVEQRLHTNRGCYQRIGETAATVQQAERNLQNLEALSNTASGKVNGKEKIELETYVQMAYFDRIVRRANYRLLVMSGGQYELVRREKGENGKKQTGLDLDVIDHYYGNNSTSRNVSTLSGGESFLASLSLALGLSDEVLHSSNGIQLDTLFVDEGFGSLDEETLQQAMTALLKMTEGGRLVGIISHVGELKNSIPRQIVVKKEKSGGSQATIVV
jgi:exonuclease SbcC